MKRDVRVQKGPLKKNKKFEKDMDGDDDETEFQDIYLLGDDEDDDFEDIDDDELNAEVRLPLGTEE